MNIVTLILSLKNTKIKVPKYILIKIIADAGYAFYFTPVIPELLYKNFSSFELFEMALNYYPNSKICCDYYFNGISKNNYYDIFCSVLKAGHVEYIDKLWKLIPKKAKCGVMIMYDTIPPHAFLHIWNTYSVNKVILKKLITSRPVLKIKEFMQW